MSVCMCISSNQQQKSFSQVIYQTYPKYHKKDMIVLLEINRYLV